MWAPPPDDPPHTRSLPGRQQETSLSEQQTTASTTSIPGTGAGSVTLAPAAQAAARTNVAWRLEADGYMTSDESLSSAMKLFTSGGSAILKACGTPRHGRCTSWTAPANGPLRSGRAARPAARPDRFRVVRPGVKGQRHTGRGEIVELEPGHQVGQRQKHEEHLHQQRRAPDHPDIEGGDPAQRRDARQPPQRTQHPQHQTGQPRDQARNWNGAWRAAKPSTASRHSCRPPSVRCPNHAPCVPPSKHFSTCRCTATSCWPS